MPFTLSHPAAVLPLLRAAGARGPLVASALVAGSMAPDVPFFADSLLSGLYGQGGLTHQWWAVPTVDVAIAGVLVAGWHGLVRGPLVGLLPDRWAGAAEALTARRSGATRAGGVVGAAWFAGSAALGAATHVGWDAFTHEGRLGVTLLPVLDRTVAGLPLYTVLQYGSSALALAALAGHLGRAARAVEPARPQVVLPRGGAADGRRGAGCGDGGRGGAPARAAAAEPDPRVLLRGRSGPRGRRRRLRAGARRRTAAGEVGRHPPGRSRARAGAGVTAGRPQALRSSA